MIHIKSSNINKYGSKLDKKELCFDIIGRRSQMPIVHGDLYGAQEASM